MAGSANDEFLVISVYGADWCGDCRRTKAQLTELGVEFEYLDVEANPDLAERAVEISGKQSIPVVVFPDGSHMVEPSNPALAARLNDFGLLDS